MKKILLSVVAVIIGISMVAAPVFAEDSALTDDPHDDCVKTAIIGGGEVCDDEKGSGVTNLLMTIVNFMSVGVGILGVVGISVVGIQYLTAGGSEEQTRKAKRRMLEIVIGLAVYAVFYAILSWLGASSGS